MTEHYKLQTFRVLKCAEPGPEVHDAFEAGATARAIFARECDADVEQFAVLAFNARARITGYKIVAKGSVTACLVHPREVFRAALALSAVSIIVVHNHPSGDVSPSQEDETLTLRLRTAGEVLGIPLLDHIIISRTEFRSIGGFAE